MNHFAGARRLVFKVGTSTLTHETGNLNLRRMRDLARVLSDLKNAGREIVLVSSGAIGVGVGKLKLERRPHDVAGRQACAAVGQCELMYIYDKLFSEYGHATAQVLLTRDCVDDRIRNMNIQNAFERLLDMGALPIVNENDTVAVEEIVFGDNDTLSALVARIVRADALIILTDIDGLHEENPRVNPNAKLIPRRRGDHAAPARDRRRHRFQPRHRRHDHQGAGGRHRHARGRDHRDRGRSDPDDIYRLLDGEARGTIFLPRREVV